MYLFPAGGSGGPEQRDWSAIVDAAARRSWVGLVLMLATDVVLRNSDGDVPQVGVLLLWVVAFFVPFFAAVSRPVHHSGPDPAARARGATAGQR